MKTWHVEQQPTAIIITFPVAFLLDLARNKFKNDHRKHGNKSFLTKVGYDLAILQIEKVRMNQRHAYWLHSIGSRPTKEVGFVYITILGKILYKAKILHWEEGGAKHFPDGRKHTAKHWLYLNEFKRTEEFKKGGFQGFRYVKPGSELDKLKLID